MQYLVHTLERIPVVCVWEITNKCNLRCIHCESSCGPPRANELTTEEALELCDHLANLGTKTVNLSGGEPLVRSDWPIIARRLKELDISVNLITNGTLFNRKNAETCRDIKIDRVAISIDGLLKTHDSIRKYPKEINKSPFRQAYEALTLSTAMGFETIVITHINGRNIDELPQMLEVFSLVPINAWQIQLGSPQGRMIDTEEEYLISPSQLPQIVDFIVQHNEDPIPILVTDDIGYYTSAEPLIRKTNSEQYPFWLGCYAGVTQVALESDGSVKGCPSLSEEFIEGNIRERPLEEIWNDPQAFKYNLKWDIQKLKGYCKTCEYKHLCRGGCTSFAHATTGTYYKNKYCLHQIEERKNK